jgi:ribokinase
MLAQCDILVPNQFEARTLTGMSVDTCEEAFAACEALLSRGPRTVIVTMGAQGTVALTRDSRHFVPAFAVDVVDTVGAGDAFCAALGVALGRGDALDDAMRFANAAGAVACTRAGAEPSMPWLQEIEDLMAKGVRA